MLSLTVGTIILADVLFQEKILITLYGNNNASTSFVKKLGDNMFRPRFWYLTC